MDQTNKVAHILQCMPGFRRWILTTKLFNLVVELSERSSVMETRLDAFTEAETLSIDFNGTPIKTPEDLPLPMIFKFLENYPLEEITNQIKNNEQRNLEIWYYQAGETENRNAWRCADIVCTGTIL